MTYPTVAEIRAQVEAAKIVAVSRFRAETGCATAREFVDQRLRPAIAASASPADAMRKALGR
jgi:predicted NAD-dependent protein-ADP-ribosyltransferase YbiA (DUF1768 family)